MAIAKLEICGFRGFSTKQSCSFAIPDGSTAGSGLTAIVGPNNSGKSTVTEALRALGHGQAPSFTEGRRNKRAGDRVEITARKSDGSFRTLQSIEAGSSETRIQQPQGNSDDWRIFSIPSRRYFSPFFGRNDLTRQSYLTNNPLPTVREAAHDRGAYRLFAAQKNRPKFDGVLKQIIDPPPEWRIDQTDTGQYYLKITSAGATHSSEGMGEGLVSLMLIVDALYDSSEDDIIVIDEPELSLHPALQRKLGTVLLKYSATRQIIYSTHSPYFIDLDSFLGGGAIARVYSDLEGSKIAQLTDESRKAIRGLLKNLNNPHIVGLDAKEVFFLNDKVVLVEGQEDALIYPRIAQKLSLEIGGEIYGWGIGGAGNMTSIARVLSELGFKKVFGILDGNQSDAVSELSVTFPSYQFVAIPFDDVRSKPDVKPRCEVLGLTDTRGDLPGENFEVARELVQSINSYLSC